VERLVLIGAATEMCVVQSAIDGKEIGYKISILRDACAAVDDDMERLSLEYAERVVGAFVDTVDGWRPG
jgi:nicotinamidase-related amidase